MTRQIKLRCPACGTIRTKEGCSWCRDQWDLPILNMIPPNLLHDPVRRAEIERYRAVAESGPAAYEGHTEARPDVRARLVRELLVDLGVTAYAEVGPGFGELLAATPDFERVAIDHSWQFLIDIHERMPEVRCVRGLADCLPLHHTPALVADSLFQALPYKEAFLCEAARVTDVLVMSVAFRWNYPRRPQQGFDVTKEDERQVLVRFLEELGFGVEQRWLAVESGEWTPAWYESDYLYLVCRK